MGILLVGCELWVVRCEGMMHYRKAHSTARLHNPQLTTHNLIKAMQKDSKLFDDFAKLASGATGTFLDMKREIEAIVMDKMEKLMGRMHLVKREEFEVVRAMAEEARLSQERMAEQ